MDLTFSTTDVAGQDPTGSGKSNYGVHIANCDSFTISRCSIWSGNAGDGLLGADGEIGYDNSWGWGQDGFCTSITLSWDCVLGADNGGAGGQGGQGSDGSLGGIGGYEAPGPNHGGAGVPANEFTVEAVVVVVQDKTNVKLLLATQVTRQDGEDQDLHVTG